MICNWLDDNIDDRRGASNEHTTADKSLLKRTGVCRDFAHLADEGRTTIEADRDAQDQWVAYVNDVASFTLFPTCGSWYLGANVPGKPRRLLSYIGGVGTYRQKCAEEAAAGYPAFRMS